MQLWYLDEAGINKDERFLVVGGFCIDDENYEHISKEFIKFRQEHMPNPTRKLDMKRLIRGKGWFQTLTLAQRETLLEKFYELIEKLDLRIVITMIDRDFSSKIRNKMHFAFECLFERICLNMDDINKIKGKTELGLLFYDNNGIKEVSSWFKQFYKKGTAYVSNKNLIETAVPLEMSQSELLQISDLIICTYAYLLKANSGQKASQWIKKTLEKGFKIITSKAKIVKTQNNGNSISSIKIYDKG